MNDLNQKEDTMSQGTAAVPSTEVNEPDEAERLRIQRIVEQAADAAFRTRVQSAVTRLVNEHGMAELDQRKRHARIQPARWSALTGSTRAAVSPEEFQVFAGVLSVSPRWLAVGSADLVEDVDSLLLWERELVLA